MKKQKFSGSRHTDLVIQNVEDQGRPTSPDYHVKADSQVRLNCARDAPKRRKLR